MPAQYVTAPAAASVEVAPAEGVTYTVAPQATVAPSFTMGESYTYIDYDNASFVEPAPVCVDPAAAATTETAAAITTTPATTAKSSKKKGSKKKKSSKKFGCC